MPFNSIQAEKVTLFFLYILQSKRNEENEKNKIIYNNDTNDNKLLSLIKPIYNKKLTFIPGILLVPNPKAGIIFGYIDFAFLAALTYVLGSFFYMVSSVLNWYENDYGYTANSIFNLLAAVTFIINVLFCFLDWYMQRNQIYSFCEDQAEYDKNGIKISKDGIVVLDDNDYSATSALTVNMYYFWNNLYFLFAAVVYTFQGIALLNYSIIPYCNTDTFCNNFYMNMFGSLFYVLSGYYSLKEYIVTRKIREEECLSQLPLFGAPYWDIDWFGWGNICYMPAGITAFIQSFTSNFGGPSDDDNRYDTVYLLGNWFFMVNSLQYFIGYVIFIIKMKRSLETSITDMEMVQENRDSIFEVPVEALTSLCSNPRKINEIVDRLNPEDRKSFSSARNSFAERVSFGSEIKRIGTPPLPSHTTAIDRLSSRITIIKNPINRVQSMNSEQQNNDHNNQNNDIINNSSISININRINETSNK